MVNLLDKALLTYRRTKRRRRTYMDFKMCHKNSKTRSSLHSLGIISMNSSITLSRAINSLDVIIHCFADISNPSANAKQLELLSKYNMDVPKSHSAVTTDEVLNILCIFF